MRQWRCGGVRHQRNGSDVTHIYLRDTWRVGREREEEEGRGAGGERVGGGENCRAGVIGGLGEGYKKEQDKEDEMRERRGGGREGMRISRERWISRRRCCQKS